MEMEAWIPGPSTILYSFLLGCGMHKDFLQNEELGAS